MRKQSVFLGLIIMFSALIVPVSITAQSSRETILQSYERIFIRSSLNSKVNVLSDAAFDEAANDAYTVEACGKNPKECQVKNACEDYRPIHLSSLVDD